MSSEPRFRISFWIDWGPSAYLWARNQAAEDVFGGPNIPADRLPISEQLYERGEALAEWYQNSLNWDFPNFPGPWRQDECDAFREHARAFFMDLCYELGPEFEVTYDQVEPDEDPDLDAYLRDPRNFRR